jgi:hypothetical protein
MTAMADAITKFMKRQHEVLENKYDSAMRFIHKTLGSGAAGNWTKYPCKAIVEEGQMFPTLAGGCNAAGNIIERINMEWGGGMPVAWGRMGAYDIPEMMILHDWQFWTKYATPGMAKWFGASITKVVADTLRAARGGTYLYVGHDTDITSLNANFGIGWDASPFPVNTTLPGSILRIERDGDEVSASYLHIANFSNMDGAMVEEPALFGDQAKQIPFAELERLAKANIIPECAVPFDVPEVLSSNIVV